MTHIAITDSGLGGLIVCAELERALREAGRGDARVTYVNAWPEHGTGYNDMPDMASRARVFDKVLSSVSSLAPARLVIACNTLSIVYGDTAFSRSPAMPVLGIIDAGIDLFAEALSTDPACGIVLMGTLTTIGSGTHRAGMVARGISADRITTVSCHGLAKAVETEPAGRAVSDLIARCTSTACEERPAGEELLLGICCTHYSYVSEQIRAALEEKCRRSVRTLDPAGRLVSEAMRAFPGGDTSNRSPAVTVVSKVEMSEAKRQAIAARLERVSPATAAALLSYTRVPDLF
jgi:glutamate racemase